MKTRFSSGLVGCLSLVISACASDDDAPAAAPNAAANPTGTREDPAANADNALPETAPETGTPEPPIANDAASTNPELLVIPSLEVSELRWRSCGQFQDRDLECAEVSVPVDYDEPDGEKLPIAMRRILANPLEPYRGALLINRGGPGGEGIDFSLNQFQQGIFEAIAPGFDIIGFDPRGVGQSGERGCGILPDELYPAAADGDAPSSALDTFMDELSTRGERCEAEWGPLFRELGSNNVVRDMEEMRKALRQPVLNFFGASYGTRLGALYAHEFPASTGRIVLDAPVHPRANFIEILRGQFYQVLALQEQLFVACEAAEIPCPIEARALFDQMLGNARARGLEAAFAGLWRDSLGSQGGLQLILAMFDNEVVDPGGDWIESYLTGGGADSGSGDVAFASVTCADDTVEPPTFAQTQSIVTEFSDASPIFADVAVFAGLCAAWPTTRDPVPLPTALDARQPLMVIGGLYDWRTPYPWAQAMTEAIGNATLLTSSHFGHVALANPSQCVVDAIRAYLTTGSLPAAGATCS